ncbi:Glycerol-3-phosphate dehydrogenase [Leucobacter sp. 7(1)]|uniref:glycerol-3-phosphate dehydrogenase/oxidase n=1 Tax=Leucobacter sp. 7(1) TaxID=1255613 RepID=UPI00097E7C7F|nr:glycerol-3-phosphate dehydrogenase/oxidase [Leucobacter sp. 7(1)]SJN08912.1 Glycerol-3-phosphate dehydrogenase [Leucobacter sp. 7(1)]
MFSERPGDLNDATRAAALAHLAEHEVDVFVIGGGVTGAGVALDAATRGLSVALCEARDLASGTSGFSSKLVHGGLRYLAHGDLPLAWESAVERAALMRRIAPHLVRPRAFLVPRFAGTGADETGARTAGSRTAGSRTAGSRTADALTETGIRLADVLRAASGLSAQVLPRPRRVDARGARLLAPTLREHGLRGGLVYWDGALEDDTRLVVALARTAARHGAHIITGCPVRHATATEAWLGSGERVRAKVVINAAGVWSGEFAPGLPLTPSRGTHLVFRSAVFGDPRTVLTVPVPGHFGRYVFVLPQSNGLCYLGLTDDPAPGADGYNPAVPEADIDFLLRTASAALDTPLTRSDVLSSFAGLRPLIGAGDDPAAASRRHLVRDEPGEPITITGGKLTVYRRMAEDAVDAAARRLGFGATHRAARSVTARVPLLGAPGSGDFGAFAWPAPDPGGAVSARLTARYGAERSRIAALATADPLLAAEVAPGSAVTGAEVVFAVRAEGARSPDDVLERRSRLALDPDLARTALPAVTALIERVRAAGFS